MTFERADQRMVEAVKKLTLHEGHTKYPSPSPIYDGDTEYEIKNISNNRTRFLVNLKFCLILLTKDQFRHEPHSLVKREGVSPSYFTRLVRLSYLAPDITQAILDGRQPRDLTADKLLVHSRLPLTWDEQRRMLGFA